MSTIAISKHIRMLKNRDGQEIFFVSTAPTYVFMTGYQQLGITGDAGAPVAVDPNGGPYIEKGSDISMYTGSEGKQVVREITLTGNGVQFFIK